MFFSMLKILILKIQSIFMSDFYCISYKRFSKWHLKIYPTLHVGQSVLAISADCTLLGKMSANRPLRPDDGRHSTRNKVSVWALNLLVARGSARWKRTHITMAFWPVNTFSFFFFSYTALTRGPHLSVRPAHRPVGPLDP